MGVVVEFYFHFLWCYFFVHFFVSSWKGFGYMQNYLLVGLLIFFWFVFMIVLASSKLPVQCCHFLTKSRHFVNGASNEWTKLLLDEVHMCLVCQNVAFWGWGWANFLFFIDTYWTRSLSCLSGLPISVWYNFAVWISSSDRIMRNSQVNFGDAKL